MSLEGGCLVSHSADGTAAWVWHGTRDSVAIWGGDEAGRCRVGHGAAALAAFRCVRLGRAVDFIGAVNRECVLCTCICAAF